MDDSLIDDLTAATNEVSSRYFDIEKIQYVIAKLSCYVNNDTTLRDTHAAYKSIEDYYFISRNGINDKDLLDKIEDCLIKITGLNLDQYTNGVKNSELVTYAYYALSIVCIIKDNNYKVIRYILRMFSSNPRMSRNELAQDIFDTCFRHKLDDIYRNHLYLFSGKPRIDKNEISSYYLLQKYANRNAVQIEIFEQIVDEKCKKIANEALQILNGLSTYLLDEF